MNRYQIEIKTAPHESWMHPSSWSTDDINEARDMLRRAEARWMRARLIDGNTGEQVAPPAHSLAYIDGMDDGAEWDLDGFDSLEDAARTSVGWDEATINAVGASRCAAIWGVAEGTDEFDAACADYNRGVVAAIRKRTKSERETTTTTTTTMTGYDAIEYAAAHGLTLSKYADPTEVARDGLTVEEAREIAAQDPSLVWCDASVITRRSRLGWTTYADALHWAREQIDSATQFADSSIRDQIDDMAEDLAAEAWREGKEPDVVAWLEGE